jgi:ubiquinone/menaquinone biosynthesis C-methylase UbiE
MVTQAGGYVARNHYQAPEVARGYDRARFRSPFGRLRHALDRRALRRCLVEVPAGERVLDLACGTGRITAFLAAQGYNVVGADVSPAMLAVARRRCPAVPFVVADAERLPVGESAAPAVTAVRFLGNLPRQARVNALRAAGVAGDLVIVDHSVRSRLGDLRRRLVSPQRNRVAHAPWAFVTNAELAAELAEAGLVERRRIYRLPVLSDCVYLVLERH